MTKSCSRASGQRCPWKPANLTRHLDVADESDLRDATKVGRSGNSAARRGDSESPPLLPSDERGPTAQAPAGYRRCCPRECACQRPSCRMQPGWLFVRTACASLVAEARCSWSRIESSIVCHLPAPPRSYASIRDHLELPLAQPLRSQRSSADSWRASP